MPLKLFVEIVACLAVEGVVQLTASGWFAGTTAFRVGALIVCMPTPPTTTPCTLSVFRVTESPKSPLGNWAIEFRYLPEPAWASTSDTLPFGKPLLEIVTVAAGTLLPRPSLRVTVKFVTGAPLFIEASMAPVTSRVDVPVPALLWLVAVPPPQARAGAAGDGGRLGGFLFFCRGVV